MSQANQHAYESEVQDPVTKSRLDSNVAMLQKQFKAEKIQLAGHELTPAQAIEVLKLKESDSQGFDVDGIRGSDCYRFMNEGLRNNVSVAYEAFKHDPTTAKHFPHALQARMDGRPPHEALPRLEFVSKLCQDMTPSRTHAKSQTSRSI